MKKPLMTVLVITALAGWTGLWSSSPAGNGLQTGPIVLHDLYHDISLPVRDYPSRVPQGIGPQTRPPEIRRMIPAAELNQPDGAPQLLRLPPVSAKVLLDFDGIPNTANGNLASVPPDENASVGDTQVVETINTAYQVFDKTTGNSIFGPVQISAIFNGVTGLCGQGQTFNFTDPIVVYDKMANRWVMTIIASDSSFSVGNECIAVSTTSDATGSYARYEFKFGSQGFNDYPKFGVWPDAYYGSYNLFNNTGVAADACAYDRAAMLAGQSTTAICFQNTSEFSFLPSDLDGATPPSAGEPNFYVDLFSSTLLHLFKFHVDFAHPKNSTFTGPTPITIASYSPACGGGTCIPQRSTGQQLDSLGDRLMFRLAYRNFTDHEALVVNHSVATTKAASGVRWYEIRSPNATPLVYQQSTFKSGGQSLWMGSIAMDKAGDIAVGYSASSTTLYPSIYFAGRVPSDPLNILESPKIIFKGAGAQTGANRWGDYSSMAIDPSDDCTFWYTNEYYAVSSAIDFNTRMASFKFRRCH
jgi:hypothetical protein